MIGFFLFGETVPRFWGFFNNAGDMGRFTLPQWLGIDAGAVVFVVVSMALLMFWGGGKLERIFTARRNARTQP